MPQPKHSGKLVLLAASLVSAVLGSIHAFSVFLAPLQAGFGASRATISLTYSIGLVCITLAVLFGPSVYARIRPAIIYLMVSIFGAIGALVAGSGESLITVWIGYGIIFGTANGLGYGFGLQFAARANPGQGGMAMGVVTAAYALGAVVAPYGFEKALAFGDFKTAMLALAFAVALAGVVAAILVAKAGQEYSGEQTIGATETLPTFRLAIIWLAYGCAVAAGLMSIGHAAGIASEAGYEGWIAPTMLALFNLSGSLVSGRLADRMSHRLILTFLPLLSAASLIALAVSPGFTLICLSLIGFAYGGTIAVYPAAISVMFPAEQGPRAYGRIFTAWGAAGLMAPWLAGRIYDLSGDYETALWIAAALALISALVAHRLIWRQ